MLRIFNAEFDKPIVTLRMEGQIAGPWVDELRRATENFLGSGHRLTLDLTEVTFADQNGVALLLKLQEQTVSMMGCSPFLSEQLKGMTDSTRR